MSKRHMLELAFLFAAGAGIMSGHWTAETWWHWSQDSWFEHPSPIWGFGFTIAFVTCSIFLFRWRGVVFHARTRIPHWQEPAKREVLFWFLSTLNPEIISKNPSGIPSGFEPTWNLAEDTKSLKAMQVRPQWNWEMALHSINHHLPKLRVLLLIVSPESAREARLLVSFLRKYHELDSLRIYLLARQENGSPKIAVIQNDDTEIPSAFGWDFEHFVELTNAIKTALNKNQWPTGEDQKRIRDRNIMIDFTGGQKVTSVVAAIMTFNRPVGTQYVSTRSRRIFGYDLEVGVAPLHSDEFGMNE